MAKTKSTQRTRTQQRKEAAKKRRRPPTFYERNRAWLILAVLGAAGVLLFVTTRDRQQPSSSGESAAFTGGDFHSLVAHPDKKGTIYAGGHQAVSGSTDGGQTWRPISTLENADAMGWAFIDGKIFVGGHPGINVSEDEGKSFERRNDGLPATDIHSLGAGKAVIYAGSPQAGFIASSDLGKTWQVRNATEGRSFFGHILVDPTDDEHLYAPDSAAGLAESRDGGRSWSNLGGPTGVNWVALDTTDTSRLIVSGGGEASETRDGGKTWRRLSIPASTSIVEIDPTEPTVLYAGAHDGARVTVQVSRDGGETWQRP